MDEKRARIKAMVDDALELVEQKRREGWTKADFAKALENMLMCDKDTVDTKPALKVGYYYFQYKASRKDDGSSERTVNLTKEQLIGYANLCIKNENETFISLLKYWNNESSCAWRCYSPLKKTWNGVTWDYEYLDKLLTDE
jgi:hypothetical protein